MRSNTSIFHRLYRGDLSLIFYFSIVLVLLHLVVNHLGGYGIFRDELYYLACADHLAMGYVDQPPFSALLLKIITTLIGDSVFAIRLVPALLSGGTVFVTGLIVIRLGGGKLAQVIAIIACNTLISFAMHSYYSMNAIDFFIWALVFFIVLRIIQEEHKTDWVILGVLFGIGLMNKIGSLFLGCGLFAGLLLSDQRKWFLTPWPYVTALIASLSFVPFIIWNIQHDLAHLEFIRNASGTKYAALSPMDFLLGQLLINNPVAALVWIPGLLAFFRYPPLTTYRLLAFLYIIPLVIFIVNKTSKAEYLAPAYTILWASGAVFIEQWTMRSHRRRWVPLALNTLIIVLMLALLPMVLPILPVKTFIAYSDALGMKPTSSESKALAELPQFYADMFGWDTKARDVAKVFSSLTPEEQKKCGIYGNNYGRCGAIDYFGGAYGLPKAIGNHNNYWIWGPRNYTGELLIIMGGRLEDHANDFDKVELALISDCDYCMPYEDNMNIFICRGLKASLSSVWASEKHYD